MAKVGAVVAGIILFLIAGLGYVYPINDAGYTITQMDDLCSSGLGQLGQIFLGDVKENCRILNVMTLGIYGLGLIGIILIIVGALVSGGKRKDSKS